MAGRILLILTVFFFDAGFAPPPSLKPEPPAPPHLSREEARVLRDVFESVEDRRYTNARESRQALSDPLARAMASWKLLSSDAPFLSLAEYDVFLDQHPAWPNPITLQRKAEALLDASTPAKEVAAFFEGREPVSGFGKLHLARALLELRSEEAGRGYLVKAWTEHNFNAADSRALLADFGSLLTPEDHFAKADRALFRRSTGGVEDVEGLLSRRRAAEVAVRVDLLRGRRRGFQAYERLPEESRLDPGVLHAAVRYLRRAGQEEEAVRLSALAPLDPAELRSPEGWFYERKLLARWALKNGRFRDAYVLSAYSGLKEGADFAEAEFMAGWVALRFLGDAARARQHFGFLTQGVTTPISLARGNYWLARAYEALGDPVRARAYYSVAADYPYTFYGQLAIESIGEGAPLFAFPAAEPVTEGERTLLLQRDLARAMRILDHLDADTDFRRFALALDDQLDRPGEVKAFAELVRDAGEFDLIVRAGKTTRRSGAVVPEVIYPLVPIPEQAARFTEKPLILGLSRQESEFKVDAYSSARAKGMMQLLDSTARITARKEGIPFYSDRLLTDADYNFTLGAAHLSHLVERFGGSYVMVLAAYNAGPSRVDDWVAEYGDPRRPDVDPVDWVELIPFSETRNYVMRVLENTQVYRSRLDNLPLGLQLAEDLTRGSTASFATIGQPVPIPVLWGRAADAGAPLIEMQTLGPSLSAVWEQGTLTQPSPTAP
jgi:soluble lytic murein transglycosylase